MSDIHGRPYADRVDAGRRLASFLSDQARRPDLVVLGLPRGGVPVAYEVALELGVPLDVVVVRKLGVPYQPELAMGAVASGGVWFVNRDVVLAAGIPAQVIAAAAERELREVARRERAYRDGTPAVDPRGKVVILVDDGIATGASVQAAIAALRRRGARSVIVAVPVAPRSSCVELAEVADSVVCPLQVDGFGGVGEWYVDFSPTTDDEVRALLARARRRILAAAS